VAQLLLKQIDEVTEKMVGIEADVLVIAKQDPEFQLEVAIKLEHLKMVIKNYVDVRLIRDDT
jgi:hypothetical protein